MRKYCEECGKEGETIEVEAQVLVCAECGEEFYSEELDNATLVRTYSEYRRRHKLLLPEEIKKIREQYGLSQRSFAKLLNWTKVPCEKNGYRAFDYDKFCAMVLFLRTKIQSYRFAI